MSAHLAVADVEYVGMNRFTGRRHSSCVTGISSAFQDLDFYKAGLPYADASAEDVASILVATYEAAGIPVMSLVVDSGRGGYPQWLFQNMSGDALPRWQRAMKNLRGPKLDADGNIPKRRPRVDKQGNPIERTVDPKIEAFEERMLPVWRMNRDLGLDRSAIDAARVLRVMGAINPKSGRMARLAWPSAIHDIERVDFDAWCDALMPYTRAEMRALRAYRAAWKIANPDYVPAVKRNVRRSRRGGKWASILDDLMSLLDHRGAAQFERLKMRDLWTLFAATAISVTEGGCARAWAERLAPMIGLPIHEVEVSLSGVERGMLAHQVGETVDYKGAIREAFYDYSYARIVDDLDIGTEEAGDAGLRVLVPGGGIPLSDAERQRASRYARNPERASRLAQAESRLAVGLMAYAFRKAGATLEKCAETLGRSRSSISTALREAEAHVAENGESLLAFMFASKPMTQDSAAFQAACEASTSSKFDADAVHDVSHSIVVSDPIEAYPASEPASNAPAAAVQPGDILITRYTPYYAVIEAATARWAWGVRIEHGMWRRCHDDVIADLESGVPSASDKELLEQASLKLYHELLEAEARSRRSSPRPTSRRVSNARPVPVRTAPLAPLDLNREVELYREVSGGGGLRHGRCLVAASVVR